MEAGGRRGAHAGFWDSAEEVVLQGGVGRIDVDGLLGAVDDGLQAVRHVGVGADDGSDDVAEFAGGCGVEEDAQRLLVLFQGGVEGGVADGAVGIADVLARVVDVADALAGGVVVEVEAADGLAEGLEVVTEQAGQADEVAGGADVHGVGDGGHAGAGLVVARFKVFRDHAVGVGGGDEALAGHAHLVGEEAGSEVAVVAGGHAKEDVLAEHVDSAGVVGGLRDPAGDVDGVCAGQRSGSLKLGVEEGFLDHGLAIVESAVDLQGLDVAADGGQLLFLDFADAALWVEQDDVDALDVVEALGDGTAGVAAGGDEDGDLLVAEVGDGPGEEAGTDVLEGQGRAVEEFEGVSPVVGFDEGEREIHGLCTNALEVRAFHRAFGVGPDDLGGEVVGLRVLIAHPRFEGERGDVVREIEAIVRREAAQDGFVEGRRLVLVLGAVELHGGQAGVSRMWAPRWAMRPTWTWWSSPC